MQCLIIGERTDPHVQAVAFATKRRGTAAIVIDAATLLTHDYVLVGSTLAICSEQLDLTKGFGWIRRLAPPLWGVGLEIGSIESTRRGAALSLLAGIIRTSPRQWFTTLDALVRAEDKLVQLQAAMSLGISVPRTIVASELSAVIAALGERFLLKPIGRGYYIHEDRTPRSVFARPVDATEVRDIDFAAAPFLAQEYIKATSHLRVVTVGDRAWSAILPAESLPADWREDDQAHSSWSPSHWPDVEGSALDLAHALGVRFTSQDWVVDLRGRSTFLDLNPNGQWLFLPKAIGEQVTDEISAFLASSVPR